MNHINNKKIIKIAIDLEEFIQSRQTFLYGFCLAQVI